VALGAADPGDAAKDLARLGDQLRNSSELGF